MIVVLSTTGADTNYPSRMGKERSQLPAPLPAVVVLLVCSSRRSNKNNRTVTVHSATILCLFMIRAEDFSTTVQTTVVARLECFLGRRFASSHEQRHGGGGPCCHHHCLFLLLFGRPAGACCGAGGGGDLFLHPGSRSRCFWIAVYCDVSSPLLSLYLAHAVTMIHGPAAPVLVGNPKYHTYYR